MTEPADGSTVTSRVYTFRGVTDPGCTVDVGSRYFADVDSEGNWTLDLVLRPGVNSTTLTAADPLTGLRTRQAIRVLYEPADVEGPDEEIGDDLAGQVSGVVFQDLDGNGMLDPGEPPLPGRLVATGTASGASSETYTDAAGRYSLPRLADAVWVQSWAPPPQVETSSPLVELTSDDSGAGVHFGWSSCGGLIQTRLTNPDPAEHDRFGSAVAVSDGRVAVATDDGDVYVYSKVSGVWQPTRVQKASEATGALSASAGQYLALEGNVLVVGTSLAEANGFDSGAVRVYTEQAGEWTLTEIVSATVDHGDQLGYSVGIDQGRIVAGAPKDDSVLHYAGAAYVFDVTNGGWGETKLFSPDPGIWEWFGGSVAVDKDTVVVAERVAFEDDTAGTVHVFTLEATGWSGQELASSPPDQLGWSVAADGGWIVAGAPQIRLYSQEARKGPGYIRVFVPQEGTYASWSILPSMAAPGAEFGSDVAILHDATTDEYIIIAGAPRQEPFGAAYLYGPTSFPNMEIDRDAVVCVPRNGHRNDHFGEAVAIDQGIAVIGAPLADFENRSDGAVYVYEAP